MSEEARAIPTIGEILFRVRNTQYAKEGIERYLHLMTDDERRSLCRAILVWGDEHAPAKGTLAAENRKLLEKLERALDYADHLPTCGQHMNLPCDCDFHTERRKWEAALALAKEGK